MLASFLFVDSSLSIGIVGFELLVLSELLILRSLKKMMLHTSMTLYNTPLCLYIRGKSLQKI